MIICSIKYASVPIPSVLRYNFKFNPWLILKTCGDGKYHHHLHDILNFEAHKLLINIYQQMKTCLQTIYQ